MTATAAAEKRYFVIFEGKELGPFVRAEVDSFIRNREMRAETLVRFEDSTQWFEASKIFTGQFSLSTQSINSRLSGFNKSLSENRSGDQSSGYPREVMQWSWAAFLWGPIWAIFHKVWWGLIGFIPIPFLGLGVAIALGILGRRQAWDTESWESVEHMQERGKFWVMLWFGLFAAFVVLYLLIVGGLAALLTGE
jgi:hypothetical protein